MFGYTCTWANRKKGRVKEEKRMESIKYRGRAKKGKREIVVLVP